MSQDDRDGASVGSAATLAPTDPNALGDSPTLAGDGQSGEIPTWLAGDARYEVQAFLGAGGAGRVYRAFDRRLQRTVALKVLLSADATHIDRLLAEARAQARVEHPHVCKVYEIGELSSRPYIGMQLIDGPTLATAAARLTLEQKVRLAIDIAEAVHAAHRLGFIHRDLKPSNVMVEEREGGALHPYVMDFGLARQVDAESTGTNVIAGTPAYMAPEQARGVTLDRRTDVYGLGATLYSMVAGRPPYQDSSTVSLLVRITTEDPVALVRAAASTPRDLDAVVMKCLERDPVRRYDSARALADDLRRWLDGEPVLARRGALVYRARKKLRKHRAAAVVTAMALAAIVGGASWAARARARAAERTRVAQLLGREMERVDSVLRYAHLSPLHDTRADKAEVRARMRAIESLFAAGGGGAVPGALEYVLGRGHLALGEIEPARAQLERAWQLGFREPDVAWALGRSYGALYQRARAEVETIDSKDQRRARIAELGRTLRDPALSYLHEGGGAHAEAPAYGEALIAFYDQRYDEALQKATAAEAAPWLYEASQLIGDVHTRRAADRRLAGDTKGALDELALARAAYARAVERGRSDPAGYVASCAAARLGVQLGTDAGELSRAEFDRARQACDDALRADGDSADALATEAGLYQLAAKRDNDQRTHGTDLLRAIELAQAAIDRDPRHVEGHYILARSLILRADGEQADPRASLAAAETALHHVLELRADSRAHSDLGLLYTLRGGYEQAHGIDRTATLGRAVDSFERAIALDPTNPSPFNNLGNAYKALGDDAADAGRDAKKPLEQAIAAYRRALAYNPRYAYAWNNLGTAYTSLAGLPSLPRREVSAALDEAVAAYGHSSEANPTFMLPWVNLAEALSIRAGDAVERGDDPSGDLSAARAACTRALAINADYYYVGVKRAQIELVAARWARAHRRPTDAMLREAADALTWANAHQPEDPGEVKRLEAEVHRQRAEWLLADGSDARGEIAAGLERAHESIAVNAASPETKKVLAALERLASR